MNLEAGIYSLQKLRMSSSADATPAVATGQEEALALIRRGCEMLVALGAATPEEARLKPAIMLLTEASTIIRTVPDAGESGTLRWRLYQAVQAQGGSDNAALFKELRCAIHLGLAGECSDPVTLPCGHSFCKTCIAPFFYAGASVSNRKCPHCREIITVSYQQLKTNVAIKGVTAHLMPLGAEHDMAAIAAVEARVAPAAPAAAYGGGAAYGSSTAYGGYGGGSYAYATAYAQQQQQPLSAYPYSFQDSIAYQH